MKARSLFVFAALGLLLAIVSAVIYNRAHPPQAPVFTPAANPYRNGIYTNGIIESDQAQGQNISIYPEVSGLVTEVFASEGQKVAKGAALLHIEDSVQRATVEQLRAQAEAAQALLKELKAQPRPENLEVAKAQVELAQAGLKSAQDTYDKQSGIYKMDPTLVSKDAIDTAYNAVQVASRNLELQRRQYELTKAGAWTFEVQNQEKQVEALTRAYQSGQALAEKYTVRAPIDGVVLTIAATPGAYVTSQSGTYNSYTQGSSPAVVMGSAQKFLEVRCYVDEILVNRLPSPQKIDAQMYIRGTDVHVPLQFVRIQPYVTPKIELSSERAERVDVRVLPVIFRFERPATLGLYPGQQVDVYIGERGQGG